jgi:hypothetical protein
MPTRRTKPPAMPAHPRRRRVAAPDAPPRRRRGGARLACRRQPRPGRQGADQRLASHVGSELPQASTGAPIASPASCWRQPMASTWLRCSRRVSRRRPRPANFPASTPGLLRRGVGVVRGGGVCRRSASSGDLFGVATPARSPRGAALACRRRRRREQGLDAGGANWAIAGRWETAALGRSWAPAGRRSVLRGSMCHDSGGRRRGTSPSVPPPANSPTFFDASQTPDSRRALNVRGATGEGPRPLPARVRGGGWRLGEKREELRRGSRLSRGG